MNPISEKDTSFSPETTPTTSHPSSRSASPDVPGRPRRDGAKYRDFPSHEHGFHSRGFVHHPRPPPPPHDFHLPHEFHQPRGPHPHDFHHPHEYYTHGFASFPPPPHNNPPHMMEMHPKDPFYESFEHRKQKKSPWRKVLLGCVVCLGGATVFTLGRGFEVHRINAALKAQNDCDDGPVHAVGRNEWFWGSGPAGEFHGKHSGPNEHEVRGHGEFIEHGRHSCDHHHLPPPPPPLPPCFMKAHVGGGEFAQHDGAKPRRHDNKPHYPRGHPPPPSYQEDFDKELDGKNASSISGGPESKTEM